MTKKKKKKTGMGLSRKPNDYNQISTSTLRHFRIGSSYFNKNPSFRIIRNWKKPTLSKKKN